MEERGKAAARRASKPAGKVRRKAAEAPRPADSSDEGRAIVLFSDGTGNSSAKLFKTNVWRMYEAVDLGATAIDPEQIVYYDEGVGNSGFRPLAILGGVFGWGLKRNVLDLYRFLCRNYREKDRIYAFGFSRGAFTIRMLVGLIVNQGLVPYRDEADLSHQSADAFRAYIGRQVPRFPPMRWLLPLWRALIRLLLLGKRLILRQHRYDPDAHVRPGVRFVGVWDTVAAYGGPIIELVRAFDDWIRPLSFKDQLLSEKVEFARHALALDDERDAFHPVPWDEPYPTDRNRLKQVWFSGMHADVGGGYPDDSLAYVSLAWMMKEAQQAGLDLRSEKVVEADRVANAFGPIHDSRAGVGAYYRYQPRLVGAYVKPPEAGTESMEDPQSGDGGMNNCAWIHESVLHRIEGGIDGYSPITLPVDFRVVDHGPDDVKFPRASRDNLAATAIDRADRMESIRDWVWIRRALYFATVGASLALAALPWWVVETEVNLCSDGRCVLGEMFSWLRLVLPGLAEPWVQAFSDHPNETAILLGLILLFMTFGAIAERRLRDGTRRIWREALDGAVVTPARRGFIRTLRTSAAYQGALGFLKWTALPFVLGIAMLATLVWAALAAYTQIALAGLERDGLCKRRPPGPALTVARFRLATSETCHALPERVLKGHRYIVEFEVGRDWYDGSKPATPAGLPAAKLDYGAGYAGLPFRRIVGANYLQPAIHIRPSRRRRDMFEPVFIEQLRMQQIEGAPKRWRAEFTAPRSGELSLFVNDAVLPFRSLGPWRLDFFYTDPRYGNQGDACVTVIRADYAKRPGARALPPGPC